MSGFCLSCGSQLNGKEIYCPKCGYDISTISITQVTLNTGSHCISCGNKINEKEAYCKQCGSDITQVTVSNSGTGSIMQNIYQVKENLQQGSEIKNHLKNGGLKELLVPAAFFGVSAIIVGFII